MQSLPLYGTQLLTIPISQLPLLFLGQFSAKSEVAFYGIGNKLVLPILIITENLLSALYPILAQNYVHDKLSYLKRSRKFFLSISFSGIFIAIIFSILSKQIVSILFGVKYLEASRPLLIQIWISINMILLSFIGTIFLSSNNEKLMIKLSLFNGIFIGTASYIGSHYGAQGLALSIWISLLIGFLLHWYFIRRLKLIVINRTLEFAFLFLIIIIGNALIIIR
jgi:O-antigen/teichoic acid export membrane protein